MSKSVVTVTLRPERVQLQAVADQLPEWSLAAGGESLTRSIACASVDRAARLLGLIAGLAAGSEPVEPAVGVSLTFAPSCQPALVDLARALDRVSADFIS